MDADLIMSPFSHNLIQLPDDMHEDLRSPSQLTDEQFLAPQYQRAVGHKHTFKVILSNEMKN